MRDRTGHTMFDTYLSDLPELMTGGRVAPAWLPDGSGFGFLAGPKNHRLAWRVDLSTGEKSALFDVAKARAAIAEVTGETPPGQGVPFANFSFVATDEIRFAVGGVGLSLNLTSYRVAERPGLPLESRRYAESRPLGEPRSAFEVPSPDGRHLLSVGDHNVVMRSTSDGRAVSLTEDGTPDHEWRFDAVPVLSADTGLPGAPVCWSPDGGKVAAYKVDLRGVYRAPQVHYLKPEDEVVYRYVAKAGGILERTTLYVLDPRGRPPVELDLGDTTDTYPLSAAWLPDSSAIVVFQLSRDCRHADVFLADTTTGKVRQLFSETGDSFIRIHHAVYMAGEPGLWLTPDGRHIVWQSDRSGWRHYYLYDLDGKLIRQLTDGDWPVEDVVAIRDGYLYFTGHRDQRRPYDRHFYRVSLDGGDVQALTETPGVHDVILARTGTAFLDTYSTPVQPPVVELRTVDGRALGELARADIAGLETVGYRAPEEFTVTAADGATTLWGTLFLPHDFDPAKRYPIVEYIYGGPQLPVVPHGFVLDGPFQTVAAARAIAQLGYITVMVDARGTPGRSKDFHDASYLRWANVLADDHAAAIRQLAGRYSFIDGDRVGIIGHSWGGYSAFRCMADRPDVYKAAVASAAGFDAYAFVLYECYLDLPQNNPKGYAFADAYRLAAALDGELMLAVGTSDHLNWTDTIKMSEALIRAGKLHDFVVLPEAYHGYDSPHDTYYWRKVAQFFERNLRGDMR